MYHFANNEVLADQLAGEPVAAGLHASVACHEFAGHVDAAPFGVANSDSELLELLAKSGKQTVEVEPAAAVAPGPASVGWNPSSTVADEAWTAPVGSSSDSARQHKRTESDRLQAKKCNPGGSLGKESYRGDLIQPTYLRGLPVKVGP